MVANLPYARRPRISITNETVRAVEKVILEDRPKISKFQAEIHSPGSL